MNKIKLRLIAFWLLLTKNNFILSTTKGKEKYSHVTTVIRTDYDPQEDVKIAEQTLEIVKRKSKEK